MDLGVEFVAVDNPHANKLTIHILAAVAEHEREAISERTKAALAAAKARGTKLGTPDPAGAVKRMRAAHMANAARFAANVLPIIHEVQAAGHTSCNAIAGQLNTRKVATAKRPMDTRSGAPDFGSGGRPEVTPRRFPPPRTASPPSCPTSRPASFDPSRPGSSR